MFGGKHAPAPNYELARHRYFSDAAKSRSSCVASTEARIFSSRVGSKKFANGIGTLFEWVFFSLSSDSCTSGSLCVKSRKAHAERWPYSERISSRTSTSLSDNISMSGAHFALKRGYRGDISTVRY